MRAWVFSEESLAQALDQYDLAQMDRATGDGRVATAQLQGREFLMRFLLSAEAADLRVRSCEPGNGRN